MDQMKGPLFLAGVDRSGIGLLGDLLDGHPDVAISRRTNFWSRYHLRFGDLRRPGNLERCVTAMMESDRIRALRPDAAALLAEMRTREPTYGRLLAAIEEQNLRRLGKSRWGDKSLDAEGHADEIFREFPDAVMIHMIRDPRDRYASQATHRRASRGRVGSGAALWRWSVALADRNRSRYPGRYRVVRYEDLVAHPVEVLGELCDVIGIAFVPALTVPPSTSTAPAITTASVGRHRRDLSKRQVAFLHLVNGRRMRRLGYATEPVAMPARDLAAFILADIPLGLVQMAAWRVRKVTAARPWERRRPRT